MARECGVGAGAHHIVVIGGGIIGTAIAWHLARRGAAVTIIDQGRLGGGVTSATLAWINATAKADDPTYYRLNAGGVAAWERLAADLGSDAIGYGGEGSVAWADGEAPALAVAIARLENLGHDLARIDAAAIRELAPGIHVAATAWGYWARADRWVDAPRAATALAARIVTLGGDLVEGTRVTALRRDAGVVAVQTTGGTFTAQRVVIAAGPATQALVGLAAGPEAAACVPVRHDPGLLFDTPPLPSAARLRVHLHPPSPAGLHLRPMAGGLRMGSDAGDAVVKFRSGQIDAGAAVAAMVAEAGRLYPELAAPGLAEACAWRVGIRPVPADGVTIAGPVPGADWLHVCVTHSGVTLAPHLGRLVADELLDGRPAADLAPYRPARFRATA